jgi:hypothetical protein
VLKVFKKDEADYELRIKDTSNETWFLTIAKYKLQYIKQGDLVRIRYAKVDQITQRNVLSVMPNTNILRLHPGSKILKDFYHKIQDETEEDELLLDES